MKECAEERRERQAALFWEALALDEEKAGRRFRSGKEREALRESADCAQADAILWGLVGEHEGPIQWQARRYSRRVLSAGGTAAIESILRLGWFRGALRFDPGVGTLFSTYGSRWGLSTLQRSNDRHTSVAVDSRAFRERGPWSWLPVEGEAALYGVSAGESPEEQVGVAEDCLRVHLALSRLPRAERDMVHARYLQDVPVAEIAEARGVQRKHAHAMMRRTLGRLRSILDEPAR